MPKFKITLRQKRIFAFFAIVLSAFIAFTFLIYMPSHRRLAALRGEYQAMQDDITNFKKIVGENKPLEAVLAHFKSRLDYFDSHFPEKEEKLLREISALAGKHGLNIKAIQPGKKQMIKAINNVPINIKGCFAQEMSFQVEFSSSYKLFKEFLADLEKDFPVFVRVEDINVSKPSAKDAPLEVVLNAKAYLICAYNHGSSK